ncbi:hypothetical protein HI914_05394 [Erysiphe necator]|nr:hypothetical protein HI914_05394 [Erysiphe necator]
MIRPLVTTYAIENEAWEKLFYPTEANEFIYRYFVVERFQGRFRRMVTGELQSWEPDSVKETSRLPRNTRVDYSASRSIFLCQSAARMSRQRRTAPVDRRRDKQSSI